MQKYGNLNGVVHLSIRILSRLLNTANRALIKGENGRNFMIQLRKRETLFFLLYLFFVLH